MPLAKAGKKHIEILGDAQFKHILGIIKLIDLHSALEYYELKH